MMEVHTKVPRGIKLRYILHINVLLKLVKNFPVTRRAIRSFTFGGTF